MAAASKATKALKLALSRLHEERSLVAAYDPPVKTYLNEVEEAITELEKMHNLHKMVDEARELQEKQRGCSVMGDK